ncbi:nitrate- and nitrite sensing domain-containing protein [Micromonospora haikouensis]|uniref:nitrate- and nitrite sensing domain-containing protein n=1 Tax=Micromonospora haikouensis TaxID=686309 RepID=UPI0037A37AF7
MLLAIPLSATVLFAGWGVVSAGLQGRGADRLQSLVAVSAAVGELLDELGRERVTAAELVSSARGSANPLLEQVARTDRVVGEYRQRRDRLGAGDRDAERLLAPFDGQLMRLPGLREQVRDRSVSRTAVLVRYRVAISLGLAVRESVGQAGGADGQVADRLRVAAALSRASEYAGIQQTAVLAAGGGVLTQALQQELAGARAGYEEALLTVTQRSSGRWRSWLDQALSGPEVLAAQRVDDAVTRNRLGSRLRVDVDEWARVSAQRRERLHVVQTRVDADIAAEVSRRRAEQWATTGVLSGAALALVAVAGVLALRQGRALASRLRRVRDAVTGMAAVDLPDLVRRVSVADPADPAAMPPAPAALAAAGGSRDEVDEVTAAFDTLAAAVYRIAIDLSRQRRIAAGAVEAVGRRCQGMAHRLLRELDLAERDEADSRTLATFFRLDNLAAQLQHATQSLLVLSGRSLGAVHPEPVALVTVAQAALSRIQEYRRVVSGAIDERVAVPPALIDDLVHLLASLLDNATRYSPDEVVVTGHLLGDRVIVQVTDTGSGIEPELLRRLNSELADPAPMIEVEHIRRQGVATVALLAAAHGLRVRLLPRQTSGTVAEVEIPATKLLVATTPPPALPTGPVAGRRAPGTSPAAPHVPAAQALRTPGQPAASTRRVESPVPHPVDVTTQILPVIPPPRAARGVDQVTPVFDEVARRSPWFEEGATVHLPAAARLPAPRPRHDEPATTPNGLPRRQPMTAFVPPARPGPAVVPDPSSRGLAATAAAYQRGLSHRRFPSKGHP